MSRLVAMSGALALAGLALAACAPANDGFPPGCHEEPGNANLAGTWVLTGEGTRKSCSATDLDGGFDLRSGMPLDVRQSPGPDGTDLLALETPLTPDGGTFGFSGVVEDACVAFTITETSGPETLTLDCVGTARAAAVSGTFRGSGPSGCVTSGTFELGVTLRDDCSPDPCQNGAPCTDGPYGFTCTCPAGWAGPTCADVDHCASVPCLNGGTCVNNATGFVCECAPGWTGATCADVDPCYPEPCRNGGRCVPASGAYTCACPVGFTGSTCESDVDECALGYDDCAAEATCTNTPGSFTCTCPAGTTGDGVTCKEEKSGVHLPSCQAADTPAWAVLALALLAWSRRGAGRRRAGRT